METKRKLYIQRKIVDYYETLSIHGLTRSVKGKKAESVFWIMMLLSGLLCGCVVIHGLITKYNSQNVYTELKSKITDRNYFPSITFCEETLFRISYFSYCGKPLSYNTSTYSTCKHFPRYKEANITAMKDIFWSNGLFNVIRCKSWGGKTCNNRMYFKSKQTVNNTCVTWNYNGNFYDSYGHVSIQLEFNRPAHWKGEVQIVAIPHDPKLLELDLTKKIEMESEHTYEIKIDKTVINRLPAPFPSNCTNEESRSIFPGKYTRALCIQSHHYIEMYKQCGDVLDYHRGYIPKYYVEKFERVLTNSCILNYTKKELKEVDDCNFACETLDLNYISVSQSRNVRKNSIKSSAYQYEIAFQLRKPNEYEIIEEKQLYTLSQLVCEIGGFVGLIMGMSVISLIEILVVILLNIAKRIV